MKSEDWCTLATLFETKNLTQASRRLFLSQPALSLRLQNIERELGCQIALRSNKGLQFTPEGEYLARQALQITTLIRKSLDSVKRMQSQNLGTIRLVAPPAFCRYFLPDLLRKYTDYAPDTKFQIEAVDSSQAVKKITNQEAFGGFVNGDYYGTLPKFQYASMQAYLVSKMPLSLEEIPTRPLIIHNTTEKTQQILQTWWKNRFQTDMDIQMNVKNIDICLHMIQDGFGIGIVFGNYFQEEYALYTAPLYTSEGQPLTRDVWFVYEQNMAVSPCFQAFIRYLKEKSQL